MSHQAIDHSIYLFYCGANCYTCYWFFEWLVALHFEAEARKKEKKNTIEKVKKILLFISSYQIITTNLFNYYHDHLYWLEVTETSLGLIHGNW